MSGVLRNLVNVFNIKQLNKMILKKFMKIYQYFNFFSENPELLTINVEHTKYNNIRNIMNQWA